MSVKRIWKWMILAGVVLLALAVLIPIVVVQVSKAFTAQEQAARTDWTFSTGDVVAQSSQWQVDLTEADLGDGAEGSAAGASGHRGRGLHLLRRGRAGAAVSDGAGAEKQLRPGMDRLHALAILNPYGTGSNGLYLYFETDMATSVSYTVHVDGLTDFTAEAADASGKEYTKTHEFQLIGLVPGEVNEVTLTISGKWGNTRQTICFTVEMPETRSGYATQLEVTEGESSRGPGPRVCSP